MHEWQPLTSSMPLWKHVYARSGKNLARCARTRKAANYPAPFLVISPLPLVNNDTPRPFPEEKEKKKFVWSAPIGFDEPRGDPFTVAARSGTFAQLPRQQRIIKVLHTYNNVF